jgi:hypothetical protein
MAVIVGLDDGEALVVEWAIEGNRLGVAIHVGDAPPPGLPANQIDVSQSSDWEPLIGRTIEAVGASWGENETGEPDSVWSLRLSLSGGETVTIASGQITDGRVELAVHDLVVLFGEAWARAYRPIASYDTAFGSPVEPGSHPVSQIAVGRIGDVTLGMSREQVEATLGRPLGDRTNDGLTILTYGAVEVYLYEGAVNMVVATRPEAGSTAEGVGVGTPLRELERWVGTLTYDEDAGAWMAPNGVGIWYDIGRPLEPGEPPPPSGSHDPSLQKQRWDIRNPDESIVAAIYVMEPIE